MSASTDYSSRLSPDGDEIDSLITVLGSHDAVEREIAREGLVDIGHPAVAPLVRALEHRETQMRWEVTKTLAEIADPDSASALVPVLEDEDVGVRWLAAEGLIALEANALASLLSALVRRPDSTWLREGAHHVLHELKSGPLGELIAPVLQALSDPAPEVEAPVAAARALGKLERHG